MKLKNRNNLFLVIRTGIDSYGDITEVPIAGFLTLESADEYAGSCRQDLQDADIYEYTFGVVPLIYYDM